MGFRHFNSVLFITAAVVAAVSCKKDEEEEIKPSLEGRLGFSFPEYISAVRRDVNGNPVAKNGEAATDNKEKEFIAYEVKPSGKVFHPEGGDISYYWKQNPARLTSQDNQKNPTLEDGKPLSPDRDGNYTLYFKDSLYSCSITCGASADGYYDSSLSKYTTIVDPSTDKSIRGAGYISKDEPLKENENFIYDTRVGTGGKHKIYYITEIGGRKWFSQNLEYNYEDLSEAERAEIEPAIAFRNCEVMSGIYGRYYTYDQITDKTHPVCPSGWHVAKEQDWIDLGNALGGTSGKDSETSGFKEIDGIAHKMMADATFNGDRMWTYHTIKITNDKRLSVLPAGFVTLPVDWPENRTGIVFHSSSETVDNISNGIQYAAFIVPDAIGSDDSVGYRYITAESNTLFAATGDRKLFAGSVRCVKD